MNWKDWVLIAFNLAYIAGFTWYYISIRNFEFLWYILILVILFVVVLVLQKRIKFNYWTLSGLSLWGLLHMLGGGVRIGGDVLYGLGLIPIWVTENFYILRYDQFVHAYLYFIVVFVLWHISKKHFVKGYPKLLMIAGIFLASIGIGGLNEIAEFLPVLFLERTGVGGYYNIAWDIVFNTLGAGLASVILYFKTR